MQQMVHVGEGDAVIAISFPRYSKKAVKTMKYASSQKATTCLLYTSTLRAVLVSDLSTIHLKAEIGRLSAYCGAVSAGCGSGAGIAWLYGREKEPQALLKDVSHTIVNAQMCIRDSSKGRAGRGSPSR